MKLCCSLLNKWCHRNVGFLLMNMRIGRFERAGRTAWEQRRIRFDWKRFYLSRIQLNMEMIMWAWPWKGTTIDQWSLTVMKCSSSVDACHCCQRDGSVTLFCLLFIHTINIFIIGGYSSFVPYCPAHCRRTSFALFCFVVYEDDDATWTPFKLSPPLSPPPPTAITTRHVWIQSKRLYSQLSIKIYCHLSSASLFT